MATTPIGNGSGALAAEELLEKLTSDLARRVGNPSRLPNPAIAPSQSGAPDQNGAADQNGLPGQDGLPDQNGAPAQAGAPVPVGKVGAAGLPVSNGVTKPGAIPLPATNQAGTTAAVKPVDNLVQPAPRQHVLPPAADFASVLLAEVATTDLSKLTRLLDPSPDAANNKLLDSLLGRAVQEVAKGNVERAVGYLADYATRDPRRAEALPMEPALVEMRDKIESMVGRMAVVAKMSAEDGLSRAEQTASETSGKVMNWDTHADVLIKLAQRFFDAGGYANYARTTEITRLVSDASHPEARPAAHAMAASAAAAVTAATASGATAANQMLPGVNIPYWVSQDVPAIRTTEKGRVFAPRRRLSSPLDDVVQNMQDLKDIAASAVSQLWMRAPMLVMLLAWFGIGLTGGIAFALASHIWPDGLIASAGGFAFDLWAIGFLALVGFGFYIRVRHRP